MNEMIAIHTLALTQYRRDHGTPASSTGASSHGPSTHGTASAPHTPMYVLPSNVSHTRDTTTAPNQEIHTTE